MEDNLKILKVDYLINHCMDREYEFFGGYQRTTERISRVWFCSAKLVLKYLLIYYLWKFHFISLKCVYYRDIILLFHSWLSVFSSFSPFFCSSFQHFFTSLPLFPPDTHIHRLTGPHAQGVHLLSQGNIKHILHTHARELVGHGGVGVVSMAWPVGGCEGRFGEPRRWGVGFVPGGRWTARRTAWKTWRTAWKTQRTTWRTAWRTKERTSWHVLPPCVPRAKVCFNFFLLSLLPCLVCCLTFPPVWCFLLVWHLDFFSWVCESLDWGLSSQAGFIYW